MPNLPLAWDRPETSCPTGRWGDGVPPAADAQYPALRAALCLQCDPTEFCYIANQKRCSQRRLLDKPETPCPLGVPGWPTPGPAAPSLRST